MVEVAKFRREHTGADVATISKTPDQIVEVMRRSDGLYDLTVHRRHADNDRWDDCTATLKPQQFSVLGSIATMGAECTCGAPDEGKWADKHTEGCASHG